MVEVTNSARPDDLRSEQLPQTPTVMRSAAFLKLAIASLFAAGGPCHAADIAPLEPAGIAIGMQGYDATVVLESRGFRNIGMGLYSKAQSAGHINIRFRTGPDQHAELYLAISRLRYSRRKHNVDMEPHVVIAGLNARIGSEGRCSVVNERVASCSWTMPKKLPLIRQITLDYSKGQSISITQQAVQDLEKRIWQRQD